MTIEEARLLILEFAHKQRQGLYPCPRCGRMAMDKDPVRNALSRRVDCYVCDRCGMVEALEDLTGNQLPLSEWVIAKNPALW